MNFNWKCCFIAKTDMIGVAWLRNGKVSKDIICYRTLFRRFGMIHIKLSMPKFCLLLWCFSNFFEEIHKTRRSFVVSFLNSAEETWMKFCNFLETASLISQVTNNIKILHRTTIEMLQFKSLCTHVELLVSKY